MNVEKRKALDFNVIFIYSSITVCGSNGITYGNICAFLAARRDNPKLMLASPTDCNDSHVDDEIAVNIFAKLYDTHCKGNRPCVSGNPT